MQLEFYGAADGVTGSCHIIRVGDHQLLLDCGLVQGRGEAERSNREPFPFDAAEIDAVVLSHAHIDHSGRLPLLVQRGFGGPIYAQNATRDLCRVLLLDAASLSERDAVYESRRRKKKGQGPVEPLFTRGDAELALRQIQGLPYRQQREILPGVSIRFQDAGHILGSASVEVWVGEGDGRRKLVFSGDLGQYDSPILNDPEVVEAADLVLMESTYGDRLHRDREETVREIGEVIASARHDRGNILIPAFAIGRSQEMLYLLGQHQRDWELERWTIFLDSPMAIEASKIYWDYPQLYDAEATRLRRQLNEMPILENLHFSRLVEESQAINRIDSGAIIIAGSGMCTGGRILHHLKHNIGRKECHLLIVGYQVQGSLGRRLVDGADRVRIYGNDYPVRIQIHTVGGLSAHGDQEELLRWASGFRNQPRFFLVHGEDGAKRELRKLLRRRIGANCEIATPGQRLDLAAL
jgi:metallo-beta-lactamase family protein